MILSNQLDQIPRAQTLLHIFCHSASGIYFCQLPMFDDLFGVYSVLISLVIDPEEGDGA
jgi:hypothetical protein